MRGQFSFILQLYHGSDLFGLTTFSERGILKSATRTTVLRVYRPYQRRLDNRYTTKGSEENFHKGLFHSTPPSTF